MLPTYTVLTLHAATMQAALVYSPDEGEKSSRWGVPAVGMRLDEVVNGST